MIDNEWPNTGTKINFIIMGLLTILFFVPSFAQDNDGDIEEVIVKGNVLYLDQVNALKTPVEVINVPQTVSIFTDEDIRKQGFRAIGDIIRYTPGVNTSQGEGHRDAVVFRGVRSTADFYQDGVRVMSNITDLFITLSKSKFFEDQMLFYLAVEVQAVS